MRVAVTVAIGCALGSAAARAEPRLEASGFVGVDWFAADTGLGNSWAKEQVPETSPLVGARVAWLAAPHLGDFALGVEGELAVAPAFTGGASGGGGRMAYFAPVFAWRAHALLRLTRWAAVQPHLVVGGGGETVASSSPFMAKETDPLAYWGVGASIPAVGAWQFRVDARHGLMPARGGGATSTFEVQLGVAATFGLAAHRAPRVAVAPPAPPPDVDDTTDTDGDGIPDRLDACPTEAETVNGVSDDDGCPEPDPDGDGILGDADHCPDAAEDFDGFEDADGCPEPDNDHDGLDDARDACPNEPETRNGWQDADGCPDEVPAEVTHALAAALKFERGRARVTAAAAAALAPVLALLREHADVRLAIVGHPEGAGAAAAELAKRRADAVKWALVDQGIAEDRLDASAGAVAKQSVELRLAVAPLQNP